MKLLQLQLKKKGFVELVISPFIPFFLLSPFLVFDTLPRVSGNAEVDALNALKINLADPNNVIQDWDPTDGYPCKWRGVTCNNENSVTHLDLGGANLSGELVPQLGQLPNLQYLELHNNHISGKIPDVLGNLTNMERLDLYWNRLTGPIPDTLGNLQKLMILRLNHNNLSGNIPMSLTTIASLQAIDLSDNQLTGDIPVNGSFAIFTPNSFQNNPGLKPRKYTPHPTTSAPSAPGLSSGSSSGKSQAPSPSLGYFAASYVGSVLLPLLLAP